MLGPAAVAAATIAGPSSDTIVLDTVAPAVSLFAVRVVVPAPELILNVKCSIRCLNSVPLPECHAGRV